MAQSIYLSRSPIARARATLDSLCDAEYRNYTSSQGITVLVGKAIKALEDNEGYLSTLDRDEATEIANGLRASSVALTSVKVNLLYIYAAFLSFFLVIPALYAYRWCVLNQQLDEQAAALVEIASKISLLALDKKFEASFKELDQSPPKNSSCESINRKDLDTQIDLGFQIQTIASTLLEENKNAQSLGIGSYKIKHEIHKKQQLLQTLYSRFKDSSTAPVSSLRGQYECESHAIEPNRINLSQCPYNKLNVQPKWHIGDLQGSGLPNPGNNTCYLASAIQVIRFNAAFYHLLVRPLPTQELYVYGDPKPVQQLQLRQELQSKLLAVTEQLKEKKQVNPQELLNIQDLMVKMEGGGLFTSGAQQDVHECLAFFLDKLIALSCQHLNVERVKTEEDAIAHATSHWSPLAIICDYALFLEPVWPYDHLGLSRLPLNVVTEPANLLNLQVPHDEDFNVIKGYSVSQGLDRFFSKASGDSNYKLDKVAIERGLEKLKRDGLELHAQAYERIFSKGDKLWQHYTEPRLQNSPAMLPISFKRYSQHIEYSRKITGTIDFSDTLDLRNYLAPTCHSKPCQYLLTSVVCHFGDTQGGHVYMYQRLDQDRWAKVDDSKTDEMPQDFHPSKDESVYMLFYSLING